MAQAFLLQAMAAGMIHCINLPDEDTFMITPDQWNMFLTAVAVSCFGGDLASRGLDAFLHPPMHDCMKAKPPKGVVHLKADGSWLQNCALRGKSGYWTFGFPRPRKTERKAYVAGFKHGTDAMPEWAQIALSHPNMNVHRLIAFWANGKPPAGKQLACHYYCGEKLCLNPRHISWGSDSDNAYHKSWHHDNKTVHCVEPCPSKHRPSGYMSAADKRGGPIKQRAPRFEKYIA